MSEIKKLEPREVWSIFYDLTRIPRPSKHEEKIQAFAEEFGTGLGLETFKDEVGNVIIRKPATKGMENRQGVILQAHLDMVPQKNSSTQHNFATDPIQAYEDEGWVKARGTTLGSDNGIGAAAAMAVLRSKDIPHGPLEVLLTSDEETGMTGANGLKPGLLKGDILINMDSEDEGELYIGCAGGVDTTGVFAYKLEEVPPNYLPYKLSVTGLKGGHSGLDINLGRGNANKIMNSLLMETAGLFGVRLATVEGGSLRNAIPRESFAVVVVPEKKKDAFKEYVGQFEENAVNMFRKADPGLSISVAQTRMPDHVIDLRTQENVYKTIEQFPNGVIAMVKDMPSVVETSTNLAIVSSNGKAIEIASLQRSSVDKDKTRLAEDIASLIKKHGGVAEISGDYPGWKPNVNSPILETMKEVYRVRFGRVPEVKVIHAGLECGILGAKYPHWDMISFGPTIRNPHSPDEMVNIGTVGLFWDYLLATLAEIPVKQ